MWYDVLDLTDVLLANGEENRQLWSKIREEFYSVMSSINNAVHLLSKSVSGPVQKKRGTNNDMVTYITLNDDLIMDWRPLVCVTQTSLRVSSITCFAPDNSVYGHIPHRNYDICTILYLEQSWFVFIHITYEVQVFLKHGDTFHIVY